MLKNLEVADILLCLQPNKKVYHKFTDAGQLGQRQRTLLLIVWAIARVSALSKFPEPKFP